MEPKVVRVGRQNGIVQRVIIEIENKRIIFILYNGEVLETGRISIEGKRIDGLEPLWISRTAYNKAVQMAGAILHQRARKRSRA